MLVFSLEVDFGSIVIAKFLTESEIGLGDDFIAPEGMMGPEHFGDVQFEGALQMIFFA